MELDIDTARAAFEASTDFTVGLEEEFAVLDPESLELAGPSSGCATPPPATRC